MNEKVFYVVWSDGGAGPTFPDYAAASQEAERLACANPGTKFYIARVAEYAVARTTTRVRLEPGIEELQF